MSLFADMTDVAYLMVASTRGNGDMACGGPQDAFMQQEYVLKSREFVRDVQLHSVHNNRLNQSL
jgi:hypothetical protein